MYSVVNQKTRKVLRVHSAHLTDVLSTTPNRVTSALYAKNLIPFEVKTNLLSLTEDYKKASKLVLVLERQLQTHSDPDQYLHDICHVLRNQQHQTLTDIATSILKQLGQSSLHKQHSLLLLSFIPTGHSITDEDTSISPLDPDVQQYCDIMRDKYKHQPIVPTDWPPRVGQDFFGKLALLTSQDRKADPETIQQIAWCMLRGNIDKIPHFTNNKIILIDIEDVLKPNESGQSLTIVIDGPPGIGKTTLCRKLLNMWANGQIKHQQYDLVIYCPLRYNKIAQASTLRDLFVYQCREVDAVTEWFDRRHGEGLLIIFDGWDELSVELRQSSLTTRIIRKELLDKCSVIVTSRSYASSSLLDLDSINRHVEVMGFTVQEIENVVHGTLEMEPHLAEKLIQDLEVRGDVQSLCYIPLVCSIVILVYCKENGQLPTTLTQLYENFILQTIRRYVEIKKPGNIRPRQIYSLDHSVISTPFQEMCKFAYLSLKENNPRMTFSLFQVQQSLNESVVKAEFLGLMTTFTVYDDEYYQFLHLSIQEFLAAWWITKYEKTEKVFNDHFNDDHFRMCLRFVAGLTHLEHEDYKQYFNKEVDLQCKTIPQFAFKARYCSRFQQHPEIVMERIFWSTEHCSSDYFEKLDILLLQLLYESQNTTLCQVLAQSMKNHSLCLRGVRLSLFDRLCLSYFLNNSNTSWNHLDLSVLNRQQVQILTNTLTNNSQQNQCKILEVLLMYYEATDDSVYKLLKLSFLHNIQECYYTLVNISVDLCLVILQLLDFPLIKVLHLLTSCVKLKDESTNSILRRDKYSELETCIAMNSTLLEMNLQFKYNGNPTVILKTITSLINGVTGNKTITSFSLEVDDSRPLSDGTIEHLLKDNHTLQTLKLDIPNDVLPRLPSSLNIVEVNTPLTTLEIGSRESYNLSTSLLPHIKGQRCIKLCHPYQPHLLFHSHPSLQQLDLPLDTSQSVIELFTILQSNTILKALRVRIMNTFFIDSIYTDSMGTSLKNMLILNQTIEHLEIEFTMYVTSTYLSFLTTGLSHNTSLQELSIFIPVSDTNNEQIRTFFNVISQKNHLTELKLDFLLQSYLVQFQSYSDDHMKRESLIYKQVLPLVTNMLETHTTIRLLQISSIYFSVNSSPPINWIELIQHFLQAIFLHPSLQYIGLTKSTLLKDTLKAQEKSLIDQHKKLYPLKPLPIIEPLSTR